MRLTGNAAIACGVLAALNSRSEAAAVTASFVCADSIVAIRTWNGSSCVSSAIFSTAGSSSDRIARPRDFSTRTTCGDEGEDITVSPTRQYPCDLQYPQCSHFTAGSI